MPDQSTAPAIPAATDPAARRRLGRGLRAMMGAPLAVEPPRGPAATTENGDFAPPQLGRSPADQPTEPPAAPVAAPSVDAPAAAVDVAPAVNPAPASSGGPAIGAGLVELPLAAIVPGSQQPRKRFDEAALEGLAASIRASGVMQPIVVRPGAAGTYELVAGERRWRAAALAGLERVPALVRRLDDATAAEWSLVENVQRADLGPMERAEALRNLLTRFGMSQQAVAERVGLDRSTVANLIRLTELEPEIRSMLDEGTLTVGHGKALLSCDAGPTRVALATRAAADHWSVRRLEESARAAARSAGSESASGTTPAVGGLNAGPGRLARSPDLESLERRLGEHLGTKVRLRLSPGGQRGSIEIAFFDLDHFDNLMARVGFSGT